MRKLIQVGSKEEVELLLALFGSRTEPSKEKAPRSPRWPRFRRFGSAHRFDATRGARRYCAGSVIGLPLSTMWTVSIFSALSPPIL